MPQFYPPSFSSPFLSFILLFSLSVVHPSLLPFRRPSFSFPFLSFILLFSLSVVHPSLLPFCRSSFSSPLLSFIRKDAAPKDKNSSSKLRNLQGLKSFKIQELEKNFNYLVTGDRIKQYETSVLASYASYGMPGKNQVRTCERTLYFHVGKEERRFISLSFDS
jgi:hypothetical protein